MNGKRIFDVVVSISVLLLTFPLIFLAAIGIKLTSPGPVFYKAIRVGRNSIPFRMHKLRTMHVHDKAEADVITAHNDVRIFWFGNILRKTKLDEIPQFIDVLRGKMSVVGPRPEDPDIVNEHYTEEQKRTLLVKPGVTSPASIYYSTPANVNLAGLDVVETYVNNVLSEKLKVEQDYLENSNLTTDLKIVWDTFLYVVRAFGGYLVRILSAGRKT